jgi:hypothetical protein
MKKTLLPLVLGILLIAAPAHAALFTLGSYNVAFNMNDPGLVLWQQSLLGTPTSFSLATVGQSFTTALFRLGTNETSLNLDDLIPHGISVGFGFTSPPPGFGGTAHGATGGFWFKKGFGYAIWNNPLVLSFGNTGLLGISLSNATFGLPGSAIISATFELLRADSAPPVPPLQVPESSSAALLGTGLMIALGFAFLRRRRLATL